MTVHELMRWLDTYGPDEEVTFWAISHVPDHALPAGAGWRCSVEVPVRLLSDDPDTEPWLEFDLCESDFSSALAVESE